MGYRSSYQLKHGEKTMITIDNLDPSWEPEIYDPRDSDIFCSPSTAVNSRAREEEIQWGIEMVKRHTPSYASHTSRVIDELFKL